MAEVKLDERFKDEGIQTKATLIGYEYVEVTGKGGFVHSGDRPVLSYTTETNTTYRYVAREYGVVSVYGKSALPKQEIRITYLKYQPSVARVSGWYHSPIVFLLVVDVVSLFFTVLSVWVMLAAVFSSSNAS